MRTMGSLRTAGAAIIALAATLAGASAQAPDPAGAGLLQVELTLEAQRVSVSFPPALSAADAAHRALLSGAVGSRVRVGALEADRALRIGAIVPGADPPPAADAAAASPGTINRELWLAPRAAGWELQAVAAGDGDARAPAVIPLAHRAADSPAPTFVAALHPTGAESGRLVLAWGAHVWSTEFRFDDLPPLPPQQPPGANFAEALQPDSDTSATARLNTLAERNETALQLPGGERIAVLYGKGLAVDGVDYPNLPSTADGAVVALLRAPVLRLRNEAPLRFDGADLPTGNLAPGFAGSRGLWLRRAGDGWRFVFNDEPDSWGTQHDPAFDTADTPAHYSRTPGAFRPLGATLAPTSPNTARLLLHWGPHQWSADFTVTR